MNYLNKGVPLQDDFRKIYVCVLVGVGSKNEKLKYINVFTFVDVIMATITLSIPDDLKARMDAHPEVNWPEKLRRIITKKVEQLKKFQEMVDRGEI